MKPRLLFLNVIIGIPVIAMAQESPPSVISANGGSASGANMTLDWTLGEIATERITTGKANYTQGFHQPLLVVEKLKNSDSLQKNYTISIYPNPVTSVLSVKFHYAPANRFFIQLMDANGKLVLQREYPANTSLLQLNVSKYSKGAYHLKIQSADGTLLNSYNIIKAQ